MDMIKITKEMIPEVETVQVCGRDGMTIIVKKNIPYSQKEAMALELAVYGNVEDDDVDVMYDSYQDSLIECVLVAKYYTNIDFSPFNNQNEQFVIFDYLIANNMYYPMLSYVSDDLQIVRKISFAMRSSVRVRYEKNNSIAYLFKQSFGSLLNGEDIIQSISKNPDVNEQMIKMINAYRDSVSSAQQNKKAGKMQLKNGSIVNIAKKKNH